MQGVKGGTAIGQRPQLMNTSMRLTSPKNGIGVVNPIVGKLIEINRRPYEDSVVPNMIRYRDLQEHK